MTVQLVLPFSYDAVDPDISYRLKQRATRINAREARIVQDIIDNGRDFAEARDELRHNKAGGFRGWIEYHGWSHGTAYNYIQVYEQFSNCPTVGQLTPKVLYLLSASSTPTEARDEVIERAASGESITPTAAQEVIALVRAAANAGTVREMTAAVVIDEIKRRPDEPWKVVREAAETLDRIKYSPLPPEAIAADIAEVLDPPIEPAQAVELRPRVNAGLFSSATPEWYTPQHIIEAVLGMWIQIDLDPCSNSGDFDTANVPAASYWTKDDNGLAQEWHGRVYMNPPYGDEIAAWVERMVRAYENSEIAEAIALLPARTDTAWYQTLADYRMCFIRGRLKFSGSENGAPFPSVVVYLGVDDANFYEFFGRLGFIK